MAKPLDEALAFWHGPSAMDPVTANGSWRGVSAAALAMTLYGLAGVPAAMASPPLLLDPGQLRIDAAPSDFGYMDHGRINDGRGLRLFKRGDDDVGLAVGVGAAYGVVDTFELGGLVVPLQLSPDVDLGGLEVYGRFSLVRGEVDVAAQITLQLPTDDDFAMGLGAPMVFSLSRSVRLHSGAELEIVFDPDSISLDVPAALYFDVTPAFFLGPRSGLYFDDFDELIINLGAQVGGDISRRLTLSGSFNWPRFLDTRGTDALNLDWFEIIVGLTYRVQT